MAKTAIVLGPHPDDIEIGAGGTVSRLTRSGWRVELFILTSDPDSAVSSKRETEALAGAAILGLSRDNVHFCGLPDMHLAHVPSAEGIDKIRTMVRTLGIEPDLILINTAADSHTDHKAAHDLAVGAFRSKPFFMYPVVNSLKVSHFNPRVFIDISKVSGQKQAALDEHRSQVSAGRILRDQIDALDKSHGRRIGVERAEAFEVMVQAGAGEEVAKLIAELNDCPFHRFWAPILGQDARLFVLYATPVVRKTLQAGTRINYDSVGIESLNSAFASLWYGSNPMADSVFPAEAEGTEDLLDKKNILISGGATSNRFTDRYFNHFAGLRYSIDHTMPSYRDLRVHDRIRNRAIRSQYGQGMMGNETILRDLGLLTVMRNPALPEKFLLGCMGVHSPGSLGCFRVLSNPLLLLELMQIMPMPILLGPEPRSGGVIGYQVLVEQDVPPEPRAPRILHDSVHEVRMNEYEGK